MKKRLQIWFIWVVGVLLTTPVMAQQLAYPVSLDDTLHTPGVFADLDGNGVVTRADALCMVDVVLWNLVDDPWAMTHDVPPCFVGPMTAADVDCDRLLTVADVGVVADLAKYGRLNADIDVDQNAIPDTCDVPEMPLRHGDVDFDGVVTARDGACVTGVTLWYMVGFHGDVPPCQPANWRYADVNCDARVNVTDVELVYFLVRGRLNHVLDWNVNGVPDACELP